MVSNKKFDFFVVWHKCDFGCDWNSD
jgi:hypothetical protein